jgi:hypothetical protein
MFLYFLSIFISIAIIFGIHWLIEYLKMNFTVKKCKEVNKFQNEKYEQILHELAKNNNNSRANISSTNTPITSPSMESKTMENTLTEQDATELHLDLDAYINSINNS